MRFMTLVAVSYTHLDVYKRQDLARRYPDPKSLLYFWGYKLLADGVGGIHTAWLTEPYSDRPDTCGYPLAKPELMREWVLDVEKRGFGVHVHAVGNKAVEFSLDTFAEAEALGYIKKQRNSITHCDLVNDRDFPRFREHHIVAALQPAMLAPQAKWQDNLHPSHFGERMKNAWAVKRIYEQAAAVSFSSDSPVTVINPMNNIFAATQRIHADGNPPGGIHPEQKVSVAQCLYAYTYGGAYQLGKESWVGSLAVGKIADICVLDHNIFNIPPEQYKAVRSCFTMINGQVVYEKPVENR